MALRIDDISINTIIGVGSAISGNIKVNGFVRVDGDIDGDLETDGNVIIGENARLRGNLKAKSVTVGGIILGDVYANESVKLLTNSVVLGDILAHKIQIDETAVFNGHCVAIKNNEQYEEVSKAYLQSKAIKEKVSL